MYAQHTPHVAAPPPQNEGQRLLLELDLSNAEIAQLIKVSRESPRRWREGAKVPHERRADLERHLGIPSTAWDLAPRTPTPAEALASRLDPTALPPDDDGLAALVTQLQRARAEPGISTAVLAKISAVEVRAREARAKIRTWDEAAILASPAWRRIETTVLGAFDPPPDADEGLRRTHAAILRRVGEALALLDEQS
jgi:hypothetical protein